PYPATKELRISTLLHDATGTLWFGTQYGISSWVDNEIKNISNTSKAVGHNVKTLIKDKAGYVWIGGRDGLSRGSRNLSAGIDWRAPIPPEAVVNTLFEDREGNLWAGTQVDGLFRLRSAPVHMITSADGLLDREIGLVLQDSSDGFWIGTKRGLNYMRDGKIVNYTVREGLSDNYIRALAEDPAGGMWVGTFSNGLTRLNGSIVSQLGPKEGLHDGRIGAVHTDRQGALWIGTMNGLVRRQQAQFSLFSRREGLSDEAITALTEDKQGALWIGTFNGLNRLVDGKITTVPISTGSTAALILTLHSGADGSLWVGTMGLGLIRLRQGVVTRFDKSDGLPDNTISQILEDDSGALWLGSNRGIFRLDPAQLDGYTRNQGKNLAVRLFDEHDGMANRECASNGQPAAWKARDGSLWFATIRGVAVIDPRRITSNPLPPPVLLEQVVVDHREVSMKGALKLPPTTSNIEFHYTATSLVAPDNNKFKYRLIGFDPDWVYADQRRVAYYTNLPPGEYSFRALASNSDGVWNDIGATLPFTIKPYFFQKPWFVGLCVLIILLGGLGAYWIYIYNLRKRQALRAEREKMSRDLHDNLSQTMTGLLLQLDTARDIIINEPQAGLPYVDRAIELARDGIRETRNILLRLRSPKFERRSTDLVNALRRNLMRMTIGTPVRIDITQSGRQSTLPAELELELFRVTQEAVTNALRHGAATNIKVELIYRSDSVTLTVADDGHGFDPLQAPTVPGIGLGGIGERIAGLAGTLDIDSSPGKGTRVTVCIPLREVPA
ncbi:MAG: two-component regulator propeller domain-containing protein, partial [Sideroxyarcus sp.]|nr:two-component regulator propeller domain-containing protein [Sideroxyarcus sp.]